MNKMSKINNCKVFLENGISYINLGKYPQTVVTDELIINKLNEISDVNQLGYIEYNNSEYSKVVSKPYYGDYTFINGNAIITDKTYYFKVEPIKWRVLENSNGTYQLITEMILDNMSFMKFYNKKIQNREKIAFNNYEYSSIRAWLNGYDGMSYHVDDYTNKGFFDIAFMDEEKELINSKVINNQNFFDEIFKEKYICNDTIDKVFLLDYNSLENNDCNINKSVEVTDYARTKGCWTSTDIESKGNGNWWSRTSDHSGMNAIYVDYNGIIDYDFISYSFFGIRPAIEISL